LADVIPAQRNSYVAELASLAEPTPRTLEQAREDVMRDTIAQIRQSPEHLQKLQDLGTQIQNQVTSIAEIPTKFPDLKAEIKESQPFTMQEMLFTQGISVAAQSVYAAVGEKEPGAFAGPLRGFDGSLYFVELVEKIGPDETAWAEKYPEEREQIRERLTMMRENARLQDYLKQLRDESLADIETNFDVLAEALGMNATPQSPGAEAAAGGSADAPAEG